MSKEISMHIENNLIIWLPSEASPDTKRQVPKINTNLSSLKAVTVPTSLYKYFGIDKDNTDYIELGEFWVDINRLKKHLNEVKDNIPAFIFAGKIDSKVYDSKLFDKYNDKNKVFGKLTIGLRADYRTERVINFGKKTAKRNETSATKKELEFQNFIFLGFFGGGKSIIGQKSNKNLNFVELVINRDSKEIYHRINYEKIEKFKKEMNLESTLETFPDILELNDKKQIKILYDDWDDIIPEYSENNKVETITINRQADLSLQHNNIQNILALYFLNKGYKVKREKYRFIDLYVENDDETLIFEIKTSRSEIYKAIGQILVYENFVNDTNMKKPTFKKIILMDKNYTYDSKVLLTLQKYDIQLETIFNYV
ncbi:MAG: hypothetical protein OHM56_03160 [Spiroplasma phoeniceum]|nr:MAG: hypothetical protein OHM57_02615 [Spiroplasma phoeniceum]UZQ32965.1 MAG: hypothetical protein OHM56_03160 [Spiroplasma phoeniceum]